MGEEEEGKGKEKESLVKQLAQLFSGKNSQENKKPSQFLLTKPHPILKNEINNIWHSTGLKNESKGQVSVN